MNSYFLGNKKYESYKTYNNRKYLIINGKKRPISHSEQLIKINDITSKINDYETNYYEIINKNELSPVAIISPEQSLEEILSGGYDKQFPDYRSLELIHHSGRSYILVPSLLFDDARYGIAVSVNGNIFLGAGDYKGNNEYEAGMLWGGRGLVYVFGQEYDGNRVKQGIKYTQDCMGMVYAVGDNEEVEETNRIEDINFIINAISNYQLQTHKKGGLFNLNNITANSFKRLFLETELEGMNIKDEIINDLYQSFKHLKEAYLESFEVRNKGSIPLKFILEKVDELNIFKFVFNEDDKSFLKSIIINEYDSSWDSLLSKLDLSLNEVNKTIVDNMIDSGFHSTMHELAKKGYNFTDKQTDKIIKNNFTGAARVIANKYRFSDEQVNWIIEEYNSFYKALKRIANNYNFSNEQVNKMIEKECGGTLSTLVGKYEFNDNQINKMINHEWTYNFRNTINNLLLNNYEFSDEQLNKIINKKISKKLVFLYMNHESVDNQVNNLIENKSKHSLTNLVRDGYKFSNEQVNKMINHGFKNPLKALSWDYKFSDEQINELIKKRFRSAINVLTEHKYKFDDEQVNEMINKGFGRSLSNLLCEADYEFTDEQINRMINKKLKETTSILVCRDYKFTGKQVDKMIKYEFKNAINELAEKRHEFNKEQIKKIIDNNFCLASRFIYETRGYDLSEEYRKKAGHHSDIYHNPRRL